MLVRALVSLPGGPPAGQVGEVPDQAADIYIAAGLAVSVARLSDRAPGLAFPRHGS